MASALRVLCNLEHRGAAGADPDTGDGAGILTQIPDAFFRAVTGFALPEAGSYAAGLAFLPADAAERAARLRRGRRARRRRGPDRPRLARRPASTRPRAARAPARRCRTWRSCSWRARRARAASSSTAWRSACASGPSTRPASTSRRCPARTIVYKGMLSAPQVGPFFPDLSDERYAVQPRPGPLPVLHQHVPVLAAVAPVPLRRAQRRDQHRAGQQELDARPRGDARLPADPGVEVGPGIERLFPIIDPDGSDSGSFDECLELLHLGGRSLPHALLMMIPEPWENHEEMDAKRRAFYQFHAALMEPWDGPALIAFTDGTVIGAVLDRNGLRPGRYWVTSDGLVILATEVGVLDIEPARVVRRGRLQPGRIFLADTAAGRIVEDEEVKSALAAEHPYQDWLHAGLVHLDDLPDRERIVPTAADLLTRQRTFGYTEEELRVILAPMARAGAEPIGSMGTDTPRGRALRQAAAGLRLLHPAVRAGHQPAAGRHPRGARHLARHQHRPRAEPARPEPGLLPPGDPAVPGDRRAGPGQARAHQRRRQHARASPRTSSTAGSTRPAAATACAPGWPRSAPRSARRSSDGARLIVLSDRGPATPDVPGPIPSLLLTGAVHHHLIMEKTRTRVGLIVESGDARETHHVALLVGYGAAASARTWRSRPSATSPPRASSAAPTAATRPANEPDQGARQGPAQGHVEDGRLHRRLLHRRADLRGDRPRRRGHRHLLRRHRLPPRRRRLRRAGRGGRPPPRGVAAGGAGLSHRRLETGGEYQWRREGEPHLFNPETVFKLQHATRSRRYEIFKEYTSLIDDQSAKLKTLRGLFRSRDRRAGRRAGARSTRSSRSRRSCSGSPPGRCPTARSPPRRTRPWPSP